jgi:negative regulator of flagellin synthesis FlgM
MNTKINGVETRPVAVAGGQPVSRAREVAGNDDSSSSAGAGAADVSITDGARQLATLEKAIAGLPIVDDARVAATSLALEQGRYQADPRKIADRLIRMESELSSAGGGEK